MKNLPNGDSHARVVSHLVGPFEFRDRVRYSIYSARRTHDIDCRERRNRPNDVYACIYPQYRIGDTTELYLSNVSEFESEEFKWRRFTR